MYQLRERSGSYVCQLAGEAVTQTHDRCKSRLGKMWWRVPAEAERTPPVAGGWDGTWSVESDRAALRAYEMGP